MRTLQKRSERNRLSLFGEVDAMLIALGRIPEHEGSISPSTFYGQLPTISHNVLTLSSR